jgi:hypothetical protein
MAGNVKKCIVCNHKKVAQIEAKIRNGASLNSLHKLYGMSRNVLMKHKNVCMARLIADDNDTREALVGDSLIQQVQDQISMIHKLVKACDDYLTDPDDPEKYFLGERGDEIEVVYRTFDEETGRTSNMQRKASLQEMITAVESTNHYIVMSLNSKHSDPRDLLLKAIGKLETTSKFIMEASQKMIEWEHKKNAMERLSKEGVTSVTFEKQIDTITERVILARKESNTEELSRIAELPEIT